MMKNIKEKREKELKRIVRDLYKMKRNQENNRQMIVFDYLHMRVKQMQQKGLLFEIEIPEEGKDGSQKDSENKRGMGQETFSRTWYRRNRG